MVIFIAAGKGDADKTGYQHQPYSTQPINIKRKCDGDSECKIFGHVRDLADKTVETGGKAVNLIRFQIFSKNFRTGLYDFIADL